MVMCVYACVRVCLCMCVRVSVWGHGCMCMCICGMDVYVCVGGGRAVGQTGKSRYSNVCICAEGGSWKSTLLYFVLSLALTGN